MATSKTKPLIKDLVQCSAALMGTVETYGNAVAEREKIRQQLQASSDPTEQLDLAGQIRLHDRLGVKLTREAMEGKVELFLGALKALEARVAEKEAASGLKKLNPFRKMSTKRAKDALKAGYLVAGMLAKAIKG